MWRPEATLPSVPPAREAAAAAAAARSAPTRRRMCQQRRHRPGKHTLALCLQQPVATRSHPLRQLLPSASSTSWRPRRFCCTCLSLARGHSTRSRVGWRHTTARCRSSRRWCCRRPTRQHRWQCLPLVRWQPCSRFVETVASARLLMLWMHAPRAMRRDGEALPVPAARRLAATTAASRQMRSPIHNVRLGWTRGSSNSSPTLHLQPPHFPTPLQPLPC